MLFLATCFKPNNSSLNCPPPPVALDHYRDAEDRLRLDRRVQLPHAGRPVLRGVSPRFWKPGHCGSQVRGVQTPTSLFYRDRLIHGPQVW